ncbi:MAG: AmmeMemoRadiSam system protein B [bacterium]
MKIGKHRWRKDFLSTLYFLLSTSYGYIKMWHKLLIIGLSLLLPVEGCSQTQTPSKDIPQNIRQPAVAGGFYPADPTELKNQINGFLNNVQKEKIEGRIIGLMVPHAGYDYSGEVAAHCFKQLEELSFDTVVIIGMSHFAHFDGIAVDTSDAYQTPFGLVKIDTELTSALIKSDPKIKSLPQVHEKEHSLEVEIPFLQRLLKEFKIVPILMSNPNDAQVLARSLILNSKGKNILFIASSDMTHYPPYEIANKVDKKTLSLIKEMDINELVAWLNEPHEKCSTLLCGVGAVLTLMLVTKEFGIHQATVLNYANSGDVPIIGDKSRVVGYGAVIFAQKEEKAMMLDKEEQGVLLKIARRTIEDYIKNRHIPPVEVDDYPELQKPAGAFVTLTKNKQLRGCIGYIKAIAPVAQAVSKMAIAAATEDPRFSPVTKDELDQIKIEITVLSELTRINDIEQIEIGKHGLYMVKGYNSGLLLPQVATEQGWNREQFLTHTCYKAGLPPNAWKEKETEIYIFTGLIFHEE